MKNTKSMFADFVTSLTRQNNNPIIATGNEGAEQPAVDEQTAADLILENVLDIFDMTKAKADVDGYAGMTQRSVTGYDFYIEPSVILLNLMAHSNLKYNITPSIVTFDDNGNINIGANQYTNINITAQPIPNPNLIGMLFYVRRNDRLVGSGDVTISRVSSGYASNYVLGGDVGALFVWNHSVDNSVAITYARTAPAGQLTDSVNSALTANPAFFYANPQDNNVWNVAGVNTIVEAYPVTGRMSIYNALISSMLSDALPVFGKGLVDSFLANNRTITQDSATPSASTTKAAISNNAASSLVMQPPAVSKLTSIITR